MHSLIPCNGKKTDMDDILALFAYTVDVFVYNRMLRKMTWEPMIFAEFGPLASEGMYRVKFIPRRYSSAFHSDLICYWSEKQLRRRMRKHIQEEDQAG
jgi:hypothetical protein